MEESTRQTPPGWKPGVARYGVKKYLQKVSLWWRTKAIEDDAVASLLVLQRLQGGVYKQALRFKVERGGQEFVGENAFALTRVEADIVNGVEGHPSVLAQFTRWLETEYGLHEQDSIGVALDKFFDFHRGPRDLALYIADFELLSCPR